MHGFARGWLNLAILWIALTHKNWGPGEFPRSQGRAKKTTVPFNARKSDGRPRTPSSQRVNILSWLTKLIQIDLRYGL